MLRALSESRGLTLAPCVCVCVCVGVCVCVFEGPWESREEIAC